MAWVAMLFLLLGVEYRAIDKDHLETAKTEDAIRTAENAQFQSIATELQKAMTDSDQNVAATVKRMEESQNTMIGGDSYVALVMTGLTTPYWFSRGDYPLHAVTATIHDFGLENDIFTKLPLTTHHLPTLEEMMQAELRVNIGEMAPNTSRRVYPIPPLLQLRRERDLSILFLAFNGAWEEKICLRNGTNAISGIEPLASTTIVKRGKKILAHDVDPTYPKEQACNP
jgi:hypothetical protein